MDLFDAHNHLFNSQPSAEIESVKGSVVNGTRESDWESAARAANRDKTVIPAFGLHPWHARDASTEWRTRLRNYLERMPSAVGEIGLDLSRSDADLPLQIDVFREQLAMAAKLNRPAIIHCVKAFGALTDILNAQSLPACGFLMHSYGGSEELIKRLATLGAYFTFPPRALLERREKTLRALSHTPKDRLLVETDAADGGQDASQLEQCYDVLSGLLHIERKTFSSIIKENFLRLFGAIIAGTEARRNVAS